MSGTGSRAWIDVDLGALVENARTVAQITGARLLPVVKANAYGVGAVLVSKALEALDPWGYGVATIEEGAELRAAGITRPILVFLPTRAQLFDDYDRSRLTPALGDAGSILEWTARSEGAFHVEIDTGMGRAGVRWDEVDELGEAVDTPAFEGCYTHLHSADRDDGSAERQVERFLTAVGRLPRRPAILHVANSAAALRGKQFAFDLVRPGIFLYGAAPAEGLAAPRPVVSLRARVLSVRRVRKGESVSYGASWVAPRDTVVATLGIGYADGIRRDAAASGQASVLLRGKRCPIVGFVQMDMTLVETGTLEVQVGDVATFVGEEAKQRITLEEFAAWSRALPHEFLTGLGARLPRIPR
ncbi:MAG TPA: alanine racemase [Gemmatimonadales bacterium]|jgi:alanine racemase|nr:alanine racemase [Gemmatimonadales bacterium]